MQDHTTDSIWKQAIVGSQMLLVAFGALVLMPLITGLDPNVALFTAGLGTLIFHIVTGGQIPIFLASSFAFIAPVIASKGKFGLEETLGGLMAAGILYVLLSGAIKLRGTGFVTRLLPPVVIGPVIMVIGLGLAPVAVHMASGRTGDGAAQLIPQVTALWIAMISLAVTIVASVWSKGIFRLIPIMFGVIVGYVLSAFAGVVDTTPIQQAPWLAVPNFVAPAFSWGAILFMIPVAIAPAIEHIGDILAIGNVTRKNYLEKPGLHRTLLGDGLATSAAAMFGGPPNTTYSEVTGAVTLTRAFNPKYMVVAACLAIGLAFVAKLGALLQTIPGPVMGGIMTLLFGSIAVVGMNTLVRAGHSLTAPHNLVVISLILVFGIGGMQFGGGQFTLQGVSLAALVGIVLNWVLPRAEEDE